MTTPELAVFKRSNVVPTAFHIPNPEYWGYVFDGKQMHWTKAFKDKAEAENELRCLEKQLSYELIETMEDLGFYSERAKIIENQYQKGNCSSGLYNEVNG